MVREEERGLQMGAARAPATSSVLSDDSSPEVMIESWPMEKKLVDFRTVSFWRQPWASRPRPPSPRLAGRVGSWISWMV